MAFILQDVFTVEVGRKVRDFSVTLTPRSLDLKPSDSTAGKRLDLDAQNVIACKLIPDESSSRLLFKLTYCVGDSLELKSFIFSDKSDDARDSLPDKAEKWVSAICQTFSVPRKSRPNKLLMVVNPKAGKGKAVAVHRAVKKILEEADIEFETLITERQGHAEEFLQEDKNISQWGSILVLSGDGGVHEVINGIYKRHDDWRYILENVALAVMPVGSGNGLWRSMQLMREEKPKGSGHWSSLMNAIRGHACPMDLLQVVTRNGGRRLGFHSLGWGIMADVDIESERLRFLGRLRFDLWGLHRIAHLRRYRGTLSYVKVDEELMTEGELTIPESLEEGLGPGWTVEENDFIGVYVTNVPFVDAKTMLAPDCKLDDGLMWLFVVRKEATRTDLFKALCGLEDGNHLKVSHVELLKVRAVRLEPLSKEGHVTVDGELVELGAIQVSILPGAGRVMLM